MSWLFSETITELECGSSLRTKGHAPFSFLVNGLSSICSINSAWLIICAFAAKLLNQSKRVLHHDYFFSFLVKEGHFLYPYKKEHISFT